MLIEGCVYDDSRLVKIGGVKKNLLMCQKIESERYGVHLYKESPGRSDEDFLLFNYRKDRREAEEIFNKVEEMINPKS